MEHVTMPELITPTFAQVIADNPEILKVIVDHQPGEDVIVGQNYAIDCNCDQTNVKLVFCNVTIGIDDTIDERVNSCSKEKTEDKCQNRELYRNAYQREREQLKLEVAVLEARKNEIERILRLIPRQIFNRKLVARCKKDLLEAVGQLAAKKKDLGHKV